MMNVTTIINARENYAAASRMDIGSQGRCNNLWLEKNVNQDKIHKKTAANDAAYNKINERKAA